MLVLNSRGKVDASGIFSVSKDLMNGKIAEKSEGAFGTLLDSFTNVGKFDVSKVKTSARPKDDILPIKQPKLENSAASVSNDNTDSINTVNSETVKGETEPENKADNVKTEETEETKGIEETKESDDTETIEMLGCLFVQITTVVTEVLNISEDELKNALSELGIELRDLTDFDSIKDLFSFIKSDGDAMQLLTDNNLLEQLNSLSDKLQDIFKDVDPNLLNTVDFAEIKQFLIEKAAPYETDMAENEEKPIYFEEEDEAFETVAVSGDEKTITIEFTKESGAGTHTSTKEEHESLSNGKKEMTKQEVFLTGMERAHEQFTVKLENVVTPVHELREIANQILNQVKINLKPEMNMLEMQLTPEHLGKVKVAVTEANGVMTAKFTTETDVAREAIESNLIHFKETLIEQGFKVDNVEVAVGNFEFNKNENQNGSEAQSEHNGKKKFSYTEETTSIDTSDLLTQSYIDDGTSTVSYRA